MRRVGGERKLVQSRNIQTVRRTDYLPSQMRSTIPKGGNEGMGIRDLLEDGVKEEKVQGN